MRGHRICVMDLRTAGVLAAGLGGWSVAAVGDETVVLGIRCQKNWVCMVHCSAQKSQILIDIKYGHPQHGLREGAHETVSKAPKYPTSSVNILPIELWARIHRNVAGNIECGHCSVQWYPVLFARSFFELLYLAAAYAFWPEIPKLSKTTTGVWCVGTRHETVFVMSIADSIYINQKLVGSYTAKQWLGTGPQDSTFFDLCTELKDNAGSAR